MSFIRQRIQEELDDLKDRALLRKLKPPLGHDFSSNDYFSLSTNARIVQAVKRGVDSHGYGATSSRFIRGERDLYQRLEKGLATWCKTENALLFSSGYMANLGVITSLVKKNDLVFSDALNHASVIDGVRLSGARVVIFPHRDVDRLKAALKDTPENVPKFLLTESLFSMDGTIAPLPSYAEIARQHEMALIVDESHAIGIYGENGAGLIEHFGVRDQVLCSINGLGKAFGCYGAFIVGAGDIIELIKQRARTLMYTTALPPLALFAIEEALKLIQEGHQWRSTLFAHMARLSELRSSPEPLFSPIIPFLLNENNKALKAADYLSQAGFDVRAIRPPTVPEGTARLRITTNISHTHSLIDEFLLHLKACK